MGQRSVYDPHDPWAFRNTWTGEIRNSYDDLCFRTEYICETCGLDRLFDEGWIWITLIVGLTLLALCVLIPILIHIYCRSFCECLPWCQCYDRLLSVCHTMSWEQRQRSRARRRRKSQQINFEERRDGPSSEPESEVSSSPVKHHPRPIHRSYPESFYPRSVTLPPTIHQSERKIYTKDQGRVREPSVPRLKL